MIDHDLCAVPDLCCNYCADEAGKQFVLARRRAIYGPLYSPRLNSTPRRAAR